MVKIFFTIKGAVFAGVLPTAIIEFVPVPGQGGQYNEEVMREAYAAFITIMLLAPLSYFMIKFFDSSDCETARSIAIEKTRQTLLILGDDRQNKDKSQPLQNIELVTTNISSTEPLDRDSKPTV